MEVEGGVEALEAREEVAEARVEIKKLYDLNAQPRRSNTNEARNPSLVNEQGVNFRPLR